MSSRKPKFRNILKTLEELHNLYPSYNLGKHLSTALDGHDMWGINDEDLFDALVEYKAKFEMGLKRSIDDNDIAKIIKDGLRIHNSWDCADDDEFYNEYGS